MVPSVVAVVPRRSSPRHRLLPQKRLQLTRLQRRVVADLARSLVCFNGLLLHQFKLIVSYVLGTETTPAKQKTPVAEKKKDGRGRPRKSLPANGDEPSIFNAKPDVQKEPLADVPKEHTGRSYWLMKAEPESRMEKGVDVKFSIDDLAAADEPEPWDGKFLPGHMVSDMY